MSGLIHMLHDYMVYAMGV